jgi:hypothetical protein
MHKVGSRLARIILHGSTRAEFSVGNGVELAGLDSIPRTGWR